MSRSNAAIRTLRRPAREDTLRSFLIVATLGWGVWVQPSLAHAQVACQSLPLPAACVSFAFQASVTSVVDPAALLGATAFGDAISGTFTINTAVPDSDPVPNVGLYVDAIECAQIDLADRSLLFALDAALPIDDRRVEIVNDLPESAGGFTLFSDAVAAASGGYATMDIDALPAGQDILGAAAFAYAYADSCIQGLQTPCPPTLLTDESIPNAPGDVTSLDTFPLNFRFADLFGTGALSLVQADLIRLDPSVPIPCPEPSFSIIWPGVLAWAASAVRSRRRE